MKTPYEIKKLLKAYADKHKLLNPRFSWTKYEPDVITVKGWPSMQGQGAVAAGYVAEKWWKLSEYAKTLGVRLRKFGEP